MGNKVAGSQPSSTVAWRLLLGTREHLGADIAIPSQFRSAPATHWPVASSGPDDEPPAEIDQLHIIAESTTWLRRFIADPASALLTRRVIVIVDLWRPPRRGWYGRLGALPGVLRHEIRYPRISGRSMVDVMLEEPLPLRLTLAAALGALTPLRPLPAAVSADIGAAGTPPQWLPAQFHGVTLFRSAPGEDIVRPYDMILQEEPYSVCPEPLESGPLPTIGTTAATARSRTHDAVVMIDATTVNPRGRREAYGPAGRQACLVVHTPEDASPRWHMVSVDDGSTLLEGEPGHVELTEAHLAELRSIGLVHCDRLRGEDSVVEAVLLAQIAATGTPLHATDLPRATKALLATELCTAIESDVPGLACDPLDWEIRSVRQRRAALRGHGVGLVLPKIGSADYPAMARLPAVSALLVTRRPEYLREAVAGIVSQTYPELEIVVGLHGCDLPLDLRSQILDCRRPIEIIPVPRHVTFGEALGIVTRSARGSLLAKFDDDDVYGPEHLWDLVLARHYSGATVVGKGAEFVYVEPLGVTVRRSAMDAEDYTAVVAGGTMLLAKGDLEDVGGWRPLPRSVDHGLLDRVIRAGGLVYRTHPLGYVYQRRSDGHTWDPGIEYFLRRSGPQWYGLPRFAEFGGISPAKAAEPSTPPGVPLAAT